MFAEKLGYKRDVSTEANRYEEPVAIIVQEGVELHDELKEHIHENPGKYVVHRVGTDKPFTESVLEIMEEKGHKRLVCAEKHGSNPVVLNRTTVEKMDRSLDASWSDGHMFRRPAANVISIDRDDKVKDLGPKNKYEWLVNPNPEHHFEYRPKVMAIKHNGGPLMWSELMGLRPNLQEVFHHSYEHNTDNIHIDPLEQLTSIEGMALLAAEVEIERWCDKTKVEPTDEEFTAKVSSRYKDLLQKHYAGLQSAHPMFA